MALFGLEFNTQLFSWAIIVGAALIWWLYSNRNKR